MKEQNKDPDSKSKQKSGFIKRFFNLIIGKNDPKWEKRRLLKDIDRSLRRTRQKFYSPRNYTVLPQLPKFFYEFYKILGPAKTLVQHADSSGALKVIVIESFLSNELIELKNRFQEESIRERVNYTDTKKLSEELKQELLDFFAGFDAEKIRIINAHYNFLRKFLNLAHFDYYFLLKKFDTSLPEGNFFYKPNYESINGEYIVDELKDFLDLSLAIEENINWNVVLDILKDYRGVEVVSRNGWKKLLRKLQDIQRSGVLEQIIRHVDNDPYYKPNPSEPFVKIVEPYLSKIKTQTELTIQKLAKEKQGKRIEFLCNKIFGTTSIIRMKNYNEQKNALFKKKMLGGFIHTTPLNYVKAFLIDYTKKTIRDVVDLLIVKGKWTTNILSQQLSDSFQQLVEITDHLLKFDESLADDTPEGTKLRNMAIRADRDKNSARVLRQTLKECNDMAKKIMYDAAQGLIILAKNLKALIDDYSKQPHELIINWKEIDTYTDNTIKERIVNIYKNIYYFIKLLQIYNK